MSEPGTLYGLGVGPGDPELITLKALRILQAAPLVAYFAKRGRPGNARTIVDAYLGKDQQELRLEYPFTTEISVAETRYQAAMKPFYDRAAEQLGDALSSGRDVAVLCEGDPFFYGSFIHLHDRLGLDFPSEIVPGVAGMSGCWSLAKTPITHGNEVLTVLPGILPEEELIRRLADTDAAVIMKVGRQLPSIRAALARAGALERAVLVERGTMPGERVTPLRLMANGQSVPYFSIVLVPGEKGLR